MGLGLVCALPDRSSVTNRFELKPLCRLFHRVQRRTRARLRVSQPPRRPHSPSPVSDILTLASSDRRVQQPTRVITREIEATHRLCRRIVVTCDDCIAIKANQVVVLRVHRRSVTPLLAVDAAKCGRRILKCAGRHRHSKSNHARHAGPMPAMATAMSAVAAVSASRCIAPLVRPTIHE
jgi:hypothetical protein